MLSVTSAILDAGQSTASAVPLAVGSAVERQISGMDRHRYQFTLEAGQVATIAVDQLGIDAALWLVNPDGVTVVRVDDEYRVAGTESLDVLAETTAAYTVVVLASRDRAPAGAYRVRLSPPRTALARDRSLFEAQKLRTEAERLRRGDRAEAIAPAERALAIVEDLLGPHDPFVGLVALEAGLACQDGLDYPGANRHYARALEVLTATVGPDHPHTTLAQSRLGARRAAAGDVATAERLLVDALRRQERVLGPDHPLVGLTVLSLAGLSEIRGDFAGAERGYQRAAAITLKWFGDEHQRFGVVQNNLGSLYLARRDYARAQLHFERALAIQEKILGPDHPQLATPIQNLGIVAREKKDYATAERYYLRALAIREKSVGLDHPMVAGTVNNLANVYGAQGDYTRSLAMHLRALAISEKHANPWSQPVLSLGNIARTYAALGDFANALTFQQRVDAALDADMALNLAIGSERQKIAYLNMIAERTERTLSFHLRLQPDNPEAARLAVGTLLRRKGRVLDVMTDTLAAQRARADPDEQLVLDQLAETAARFARLALAGPGKTTPEEHVRQLRELQDRRERLEADISRRSSEARAALQPVSLEAVQQAIPAGVTLIEFAVYRPFDPKAPSMTVAYGQPRYAVYVVRSHDVAGIDLGEAGAIDAAVEAYRAALQDPARTDVKRLARAVDERIMQPVRRVAADASRLLVSPDGPLALIPFEALVDEDGRYLVERYPVSYVSAGRDLLRMQVARASRSGPVVLADPLFGEPDRPVTAAADVNTMYFPPLAGTRYEAQSIRSVFPDAQVLAGPRATKAALAALEAPRILHIATHGFFTAPRRDGPSAGEAAGTRRPSTDAAAPAENPLLRSGLALAGANPAATRADGILTALEAAHLDLWGTKLVTLSACDTGVGVVRNGDGVYGLRRSIFLAGAETLVMSLWPVSDAITNDLMTSYYRGLKAGMGRGDALRQVQLSLITRKGREHPFYWASFIQAGDWASLEGGR
jgi:CHAT domain-containing protein/Tfp pilus assembly protein PilF